MPADQELIFLSVRETARRLGVHENTVRNWVRQGVLTSARVPGSRFHRFDEREVQRLAMRRGRSVSSVAAQRTTLGPELVDGSQLSLWADTGDARSVFPELLRRLLASTPGISNMSVRAGDGTSAPGWDGRARAAGAPYLPEGEMRFELGVGRQPKPKADQDYEKRRDALDASEAAVLTFVFATPRRWAGAEEWATDRRAEGVFADVRVLDADDFEGWLTATPAVHHWISERLGRRPRQAETLERWWERFEARTEPTLPIALFLAGRDAERGELIDRIDRGADPIVVQADWRDDAIAFCYGALSRTDSDEERDPLALVIKSPEVWDRVIRADSPMILFPLFEDPDLHAAQHQGHQVIVPVGREQIAQGARLRLPDPDRQLASNAFEGAGLDADHAYRLAGLARRSLPALVRQLAGDPLRARPPWARPPDSEVLAPLMLLGAFTPSDGDRSVASRMAGAPFEDIERVLQRWNNTEDRPFAIASGQWHLASPEEALLIFHNDLTPADLQRWKETVREVLLETDPKLDLAPDERPAAALDGVALSHSSVLRRGVAEGVALVSTSPEPLSDGTTGLGHAKRLIRMVLEQANADHSGALWRSLADVLPSLAEAAPGEFLDAIHDDLDRRDPLLARMFDDGGRDSWMTSSPHTGLLWALETLSWSDAYLVSASSALARLHLIDPSGRLSNRPMRSLASVFVGWVRQTSANADTKAAALTQIVESEPDVGWPLVKALWPRNHGTAFPPSRPRYHREWLPASRTVTIGEWVAFVDRLATLAVKLAARDAEHWAELVQRLGPLPDETRDRVLEALDSFADPDVLSDEQRLQLWEGLDREVARHQKFPTADWSMGEGPLARMGELAARIKPSTRVERFAYLFDWRPDLPGIDPYDHGAHRERLEELRSAAVEEVVTTSGLPGVAELAQHCRLPAHVGMTLASVAPQDDLASDLIKWLDCDDAALRDVAGGWTAVRSDAAGVDWLRNTLALTEMEALDRRRALVRNAPANAGVWDLLIEIDSELSDVYWQDMTPWRVSDDQVERATRELLNHGRPWTAVDLLAGQQHTNESTFILAAALVEETLDLALEVDPQEPRGDPLGYELGLLLDLLASADGDPVKLVRYEFLFFNLLEDHREPRALFGALAHDPTFFVDLVKRVYRGRNEPKRDLDEREIALAQHSWTLLHHWRTLPGRREDGTLDGEHLKRWVADARLALTESDRADIGDEEIGRVLAASPPGTDGVTPCEPVREIIEAAGSTHLETGYHLGVVNDRGVTSRGVFEGGNQERVLARQYGDWATQTAGRWRRTSRLLRLLSEDYERDARREDERAKVSADTD